MKKIILVLFVIVLQNINAQNKSLVSYELLQNFTKEELKSKWKENKIATAISPIKSSVDAYEVIYKTKWHDGTEILASGFYFVPKNNSDELPTIVINHGSELKKEQNLRFGGLQAICIAFATDGYSVLYPHYIGLGKGEKTHLYQIAESEALANIDMIRAIKELNVEINIKNNDQLFLTGYSQGGHAAMATHKIIQEEYSDEFTVTASSPMSGAYDMTGVQSGVMFKKYEYQAYLPYLILSVQEQHKFYDGDIYDIFKEPYKTIIKENLNGNNTLRAVSKMLPDVPADMILDSLVEQIKHNPDFPFMVELRKNNVYDWKPETPIMLCYCNADEQVTYKNAFVARDKMKENGAKRVLMSNGGKKYDHNTCALFTLINTKFFFDSFKNGNKKGNKGNVGRRFLVSVAKLAIKPKK